MTAQTLTVDLNSDKELNPFWRMGGNTCHATLWLRPDLKKHLDKVKKELGFNYIRCHGILNDDMGVVSADGKTFNFDRVTEAVDGLLDLGLKPFLELSSMPGAFARGEKSIGHDGCRFRSEPPKDWKCWYRLIKALTETLLSRFGSAEVRSWYFEVWNEPNIPFWSGTMEEYFRLYDLARRAIKDTDRKLRIGGPATARTSWIDEFISHVSSPSADDPDKGTRCDFISTHAYPSDLEFLDSAQGKVILQAASVMRDLFGEVRRKIDAVLGKDFPLIMGEWNSSAGPYAWNHDDCNNAAFICKIISELAPFCQGSLYWNISDIYEEGGFHYTPFHGGYGLINVNSIPKAAFHAFRFLNSLKGHQAAVQLENTAEEHGALAASDGSRLNVLVWNYIQPGTAGLPLQFRFAGIPPELTGTKETVIPGRGSAYETWLRLGSPDYVDMEIMGALQSASVPETSRVNAGDLHDLPPGTVSFFSFNLRN